MTNKVAKSLAKQAWWMTIDGHRVPVANARTFKNEVAEKMAELYPDAPFTAVFFDKEDIRCWSLRSQGKTDVAAVANKFGGGGHPSSAGFSHPIERQTL